MGNPDAPEMEDTSASQFINKFYENATKEGNVVFSPLSAEIVLAMAYQGTSGETAEKIGKVLNVANPKDAADKYKALLEKLNSLAGVTLDLANKIFIMEGWPLKTAFKNVIQDSFFSRADNLDFADNQKAADEINHWVEVATHDKIKDLIPVDVLDDSVRLVLVNAMYFMGSWANPFEEGCTSTQPFFLSDEETIDCEMMFVFENFCYCYHSKLKSLVLELRYKVKNASMLIILPHDYDGISQLESDMMNVDLSDLMKGNRYHYGTVELSMPKFKIELAMDLKPVLAKMGLEVIFEPGAADFSETSESGEDLFVSEFLHKAFIEVNEKGTEAAAACGCIECFASGLQRFAVDHPFMFVLQTRENKENTVLFVGKVMNPSA